MTKFSVSLLAGAAAVFAAGSTQAAPLVPSAPAADDGIQNVRMVCNEWGRCWQTRGPRYYYGDAYRNYNSYNYYEPRRYRRHYGYGPGVHLDAPGVHFGFGVGQSW